MNKQILLVGVLVGMATIYVLVNVKPYLTGEVKGKYVWVESLLSENLALVKNGPSEHSYLAEFKDTKSGSGKYCLEDQVGKKIWVAYRQRDNRVIVEDWWKECPWLMS
jgi:hypothetical protein